jgi:hypothetical protein
MVTTPCIHDTDAATRFEEAKERAKFLEGKLETTDNLVESLFDNLKSARCQNEELLDLNTEVESRLLNLEQAKEVKHEVNDLLMQQHLLLKYSIYLGLVLYIFGGKEYFLAICRVHMAFIGNCCVRNRSVFSAMSHWEPIYDFILFTLDFYLN